MTHRDEAPSDDDQCDESARSELACNGDHGRLESDVEGEEDKNQQRLDSVNQVRPLELVTLTYALP